MFFLGGGKVGEAAGRVSGPARPQETCPWFWPGGALGRHPAVAGLPAERTCEPLLEGAGAEAQALTPSLEIYSSI